MSKQIIKLDESKLISLIKETVKRVLKEGREDVCNKLIALQNRFGDIQQINLPDGVKLSDIASEDVKKVTTNPGPDAKYNVKLAGGYFAIISPDAPAIVNALQAQKERDILMQKHAAKLDADNKAGNFRRLDALSPEEHKEAQKLLRQKDKIERGDPTAFKSMSQVQRYIEEKYGEHLELLTTRTRRGRDFVYQARITYVASSYADGPSYVPQKCVEDVTRFLEPFGFYYAGNKEDHDERQWSTNGWHIWKRQGAVDPYERYLRRSMYNDFPEWMEADGY